MTNRMPLLLAWLSVPVVVGLAVWGWSLQPERVIRWVFIACFSPALWAFAEIAQAGDRRPEREAILGWHRACVAWMGLAWLCTIGPRLAIAAGWLDPGWAPLLRQAWWLAIGVSMIVWGNFLPKLLSPWEVDDEPFDWQRVHRFVGWVATLGGIGLVLVWLTQTPEVARRASLAILGTVAALALGRKLISLAAPPRHGSPPTPLRPGGSRHVPGRFVGPAS